jgi:CRISPR-associated protein Csb1
MTSTLIQGSEDPVEVVLDAATRSARLVVTATLRPLNASGWFQPTGFPDLGAALYRSPAREGSLPGDDSDGEWRCLVESPQSIANRLEATCFGRDDYEGECRGIAHVRVYGNAERTEYLTSSVQESHRLSSAYLRDANTVPPTPAESGAPLNLTRLLGLRANAPVHRADVAACLFQLDPGSLLHGIWFNDKNISGGKVRFARAVSGEITAYGVVPADHGFQRRDHVSDRTDAEAGQSAETGYGSVIGTKRRFLARRITASFIVDCSLLRSYFPGANSDGAEASATAGLDPRARFLVCWALLKIRRLLDRDLRLRSECDLVVEGPPTVRGFPPMELGVLPEEAALSAAVREMVTQRRDSWRWQVVDLVWIGGGAASSRMGAAAATREGEGRRQQRRGNAPRQRPQTG